MKKVIIIFICFFTFLFYFLFNKNNDFKNKGYSEDEIKVIVNKVSKDNYSLILKYGYDKNIINILNYKNYKEKNFEKYLKYYSKNKKADLEDIITIINSNYDLMNYPASSLLASLVLEKYYINKNVARYLDYGNNHNINSKKVIGIVNSKADLGFYSNLIDSNLNDGNLILVNKFYHLNSNYIPNDLISLTGQYNKGTNNKMKKEAALALMEMIDGAKLDNIIIYNMSSYRSYEYQNTLYNNYVARDGKQNADIYSARPGYSEHQTGLCADLNEISDKFDNTDEAKWLKNNAYKYGFILRFPKDKEDITGYKYESWHYRYVGKKAAKIIYNDNITLEEYYAYYVEKEA